MSGMTKFQQQNTFKTHHGTRVPVPDGTIVWRNNLYTVISTVELFPLGALIHLSIKRNGREQIHSWRDLQHIKNELIGPEYEAVELYPAESRRVDSANQYHLYVLPKSGQRWPFGYTDRVVGDSVGARYFGAQQTDGNT